MEIVKVELGPDSYRIHIGPGLLKDADLLRQSVSGQEVLIVTNETVRPLYLDRLRESLSGLKVDSIALPDGEAYKTMASLDSIFTHLLENGHKRSTTIMALGGGVVGDIAGFAAACYQRGVNFVQVPTTLLSQVDSSVGGKTAVNHPLGKNMIGAFHQPKAVIIDTDTLQSLPDRELRAGLAEVIKHGALGDIVYFEQLEQVMDGLLARDPAVLGPVIRRSCEIKAAIVAQDEKEQGVRAHLNFGHTFGHAIENAMGYGQWLHGEAVAAGMVMAADLSHRLGMCGQADATRLRNLIVRAGLPVSPPPGMAHQFPGLMARDKKTTDQGLRLILLRGLGQAEIVDDIDEARLNETISAGGDLLAG